MSMEKLTIENAPIGTKAPSITGGYWEKVERGWKWSTGATFQRPGGDWTGELVPPAQVQAHQQKAEGKGVCMREEFEKVFRKPDCIEWNGEYYEGDGEAEEHEWHARMQSAQLGAWQAATALQADRIAALEAQRTAYLDGTCVCPHSTAGSASHYPGCPQRQAERVRELEAQIQVFRMLTLFARNRIGWDEEEENAWHKSAEVALSATAREPAYTHTEVGVKFSPVEAGYDVTFYEEKGGIPK